MCPLQASFPRGGMDLLLFGGYHIPADIHILSNKSSSKGLHSSGFILNVFTGMLDGSCPASSHPVMLSQGDTLGTV